VPSDLADLRVVGRDDQHVLPAEDALLAILVDPGGGTVDQRRGEGRHLARLIGGDVVTAGMVRRQQARADATDRIGA
jgi:hypothetical protein